jgi:glycine cleavage system H protein
MHYPKELKYTADHEWIQLIDGHTALVGITDFAQDALGDIVYFDVATIGEEVAAGAVFGVVEAVKTASDLFMPVAGKILELNPKIDQNHDDNPALVNSHPYTDGWIVKIHVKHLADVHALMSAADYEKSL